MGGRRAWGTGLGDKGVVKGLGEGEGLGLGKGLGKVKGLGRVRGGLGLRLKGDGLRVWLAYRSKTVEAIR